jgi:hypothetical protein
MAAPATPISPTAATDAAAGAPGTLNEIGSSAIAEQTALAKWNLTMNVAMAKLQSAQDLAKKIRG